jgi:hypothetical protein
MSFQSQPVDPVEVSREYDPAKSGAMEVGRARVNHLDMAGQLSWQARLAMGLVEVTRPAVEPEANNVDEFTTGQANIQPQQTVEQPQVARLIDLDEERRRLRREISEQAVPSANYEVDTHDSQAA